MQSSINQSLSIMGNVEQTVIVKGNELHELDLLKLEDVFQEIDRLKQGKNQLQTQTKSEISSKFYGVLKSVAEPMEHPE
jgi:hypothetical protein